MSTATSSPPRVARARVSWILCVWVVVTIFALTTLVWSRHVGVPLRDPDGRMFRGRLTTALLSFVLLLVAQAALRALLRERSLRGLLAQVRRSWPRERLALAVSGLLAYHVVYVCYRNLKSWNGFRTQRDEQLLDVERWLFLGHNPAVLLHDVLGYGAAAYALAFVYRSFTNLVPFSVVASLVFVERIREAYLFLTAAMWVWILGVGSYYLLPSLGPFAAAAPDFAALPHTRITDSQADYLAAREHLLTRPEAGDAFASLGAFASLHVAFTCMVLLMVRYYRLPIVVQAPTAVYLLATMLATVYFGWHFVVDVLAGVIIAVISVLLSRAIVLPRGEPVRNDG